MKYLLLLFIPVAAWAQGLSADDFLSQVAAAWAAFGGLNWAGQLALALTLTIASMKVSFINQVLWSKLGALQAWSAPVLGAFYGIVSMVVNGTPLSLANILAYFSAGAGAIILHELLDTLKSLPWVGGIYLQIIDAIENAVGGPTDNVANFAEEKARRLAKCKAS